MTNSTKLSGCMRSHLCSSLFYFILFNASWLTTRRNSLKVQSVFEKGFLWAASSSSWEILPEWGQNLPQSGACRSRKCFFKHALTLYAPARYEGKLLVTPHIGIKTEHSPHDMRVLKTIAAALCPEMGFRKILMILCYHIAWKSQQKEQIGRKKTEMERFCKIFDRLCLDINQKYLLKSSK